MEPKLTPVWMKAAIICLISIVFGLILYFTGNMQNQALGYVGYAIFFAGIIWACINYSKQMNANVTFGNVFAHGFKVTAAVAAILSVYTFIAFKFIYPEMIDVFMEEGRKQMQTQGKSEAEINQGMEIGKKFFIVIVIASMLFGSAILGAIASLIGAGVAKKNPNPNPL
jgi:hypothetical protein